MNIFKDFVKQDTILSKLSTNGSGLFLVVVLFLGTSIVLINNNSIKMILSFLLIAFFIIFDVFFISRFLRYCLKKKD